MNWNDPQIQLRLRELRELWNWRGRDSRLVRAAWGWVRLKKQILNCWKLHLWRAQPPQTGRLRVLFWLNGGMGDAVCMRRVVAAYRALLPDAFFGVYVPLAGVGEMLFGSDPNVRVLRWEEVTPKEYDLALQGCMAIKFLYINRFRIQQEAPSFWPVVERAVAAQESLGNVLEDLFLTDGLLGRWLESCGGRRFDLLAYTGGIELLHDEAVPLAVTQEAQEHFHLKGVPYVTFHDGTSHQQTVGSARPTRAWPAVRWCEFLRLFKKEFPHIKLVQLGGHNSPVYEEADLCLVNRTAVSQLPSLMAGALAHIDTESGLVHLAQCLPVRSVVIFGPSSSAFLGYAKNENLTAGPCGGCMWISVDWMLRCPLGHVPAPCTERVTAQEVLQALKGILRPVK